MSQVFTTKNGYLWVQPGGPNTPVYPLGCHDLDDIEESFGDTELIRCFDKEGNYQVVGEKVSPPDPVTTSITALQFPERDWLDKLKTSFGLYVMQRVGGNAGVFSNYKRGTVLQRCRKITRTLSNFVHHEEDNESTRAWELNAWPPLIDIVPLVVDRIATSEAQALNDVTFCNVIESYETAGENKDICKTGYAVADSAAGPATANVLYTNDYGATWAALGTDPGGAGLNLMSIVCFDYVAGVNRKLVAQEAVGASQGKVFFTDDNGATWTSVNIGGAAAGHGAKRGNALFALDAGNIWLASAAGYIYKSTDGGATWVAEESGVIAVGDYNAIHFADEKNGFAVGAAGVVARTRDGGITWNAVTVVTGTPALNAVFALDSNRVWVGTATGKLFYTVDGGVTWSERTFTGSGAGAVTDVQFINDYVGFMTKNTAGPVGSILRTINGGYDWETFTTPANTGLNALWACDENTCFGVGEVQTATAVIVKAKE